MMKRPCSNPRLRMRSRAGPIACWSGMKSSSSRGAIPREAASGGCPDCCAAAAAPNTKRCRGTHTALVSHCSTIDWWNSPPIWRPVKAIGSQRSVPGTTSRWWHSSKTPAGHAAPSSRSIRGRAGMPMAALSCSGRGAHEADGTGSTKSSNHWLNKASSMKSVWATPQPLTGHGQAPRRGSCSLRPRWPHSSQIFPADLYGSASRGASRPLHRCASSPYRSPHDRRSPCHYPSTSIPPPRAMDFRC